MSKPSAFTKGVIFGILGIILFSSKAVMVKLAYRYDVDAVTLLMLRMSFAFPFYVGIAYVYRKHVKQESTDPRHWLWLVVFGVVGYYLASLFDFLGLQYIKASLERIILFLYPTMVLLINRVFLKTPIKRAQVGAILLTYLGVVITFWGEVEIAGPHLFLGAGLVFLSALTYASYLSGSGWLIPKFGVMRFTAYAMMVSCLCVFIHFAIVSKTSLIGLEWQVYLLGLCIAFFATVIPSFLVSASIRLISSSDFSILAGIGPFATILMAAVILDERLTVVQFLGAAIVIVGITLVTRNKKTYIK